MALAPLGGRGHFGGDKSTVEWRPELVNDPRIWRLRTLGFAVRSSDLTLDKLTSEERLPAGIVELSPAIAVAAVSQDRGVAADDGGVRRQ